MAYSSSSSSSSIASSYLAPSSMAQGASAFVGSSSSDSGRTGLSDGHRTAFVHSTFSGLRSSSSASSFSATAPPSFSAVLAAVPFSVKLTAVYSLSSAPPLNVQSPVAQISKESEEAIREAWKKVNKNDSDEISIFLYNFRGKLWPSAVRVTNACYSHVEALLKDAKKLYRDKFVKVNRDDPNHWKKLIEFCKKEKDKHPIGTVKSYWEEQSNIRSYAEALNLIARLDLTKAQEIKQRRQDVQGSYSSDSSGYPASTTVPRSDSVGGREVSSESDSYRVPMEVYGIIGLVAAAVLFNRFR